ncbi:MAG: phosphomannomutase [Deltaproteobacteria bacterium]|nr:phosphomannomutase [Deltaproteobacteria bacterium]
MKSQGVAFGTSGIRGLVTRLTDQVVYAPTTGFLQYAQKKYKFRAVALAGDLRPSTRRLMIAVAQAIKDQNLRVINFGRIPTPALAAFAFEQGIPSIMVTGSHIPADRNGVKFNLPDGEVLKPDEAAIMKEQVHLPSIFDEQGNISPSLQSGLPQRDHRAGTAFLKRYLGFFPANFLTGKTIGVYQHSAVGRYLLADLLQQFGAKVVPLGRAVDYFIPVDTEAIREEDHRLARQWANDPQLNLDALVSTDGDSDRPLIAGSDGVWLRGDVLGILMARILGADFVATPVSSNTALELSGFATVGRTKIGSPYVISEMNKALDMHYQRVVGYEGNGGFLTASPLVLEGRTLPPLPTRDAFLPILTLLFQSVRAGRSIQEVTDDLPPRFTLGGLIKEIPRDRSDQLLSRLNTGSIETDQAAIATLFGKSFGTPTDIDRTDGTRMMFAHPTFGDIIVHVRPSENAPELRVHVEASSKDTAQKIFDAALSKVRELV